jgi:hypothetical protein
VSRASGPRPPAAPPRDSGRAIGQDLSGVDSKHGELVQKGLRGVWSEPLLPGKYAFNTYAAKVFPVPTTLPPRRYALASSRG